MNQITFIRSISFFSVLFLMNFIQLIVPSRPFKKERIKFMLSNLILVVFNNILLSFIPYIPYASALYVKNKNIGLLSFIELPVFFEILIGFLLLDLIIYFQHRLFHKNILLWKLHSMHHTDPMLDTTSGLRFHPLEIILSNFIKIGGILLFGISPTTVLIFEITLNALAMFNHSNIRISSTFEKILSKILITPSLHTIHHSKIKKETNSNYGFSVPWWDMLFHTFIQKGTYAQENIHIGTIPMPEKKYQIFPGMLIQPFIKSK